MSKPEPSVLLLIPAYNEEQRIGPVLREYAAYFRANYRGQFQIVVVLNGCRDNTLQVVQSAAADFPETRYHVAMPLGIDELILELLFKRANHCAGNGYLCDSCRGTIRSGEPETAAIALQGANAHAAPHEKPADANGMQVCSTCPYAKAISEGATFVPAGAATVNT